MQKICLCKKVKAKSKDKILSAVQLGKLANDFFKKPSSRGSLVLITFYTLNVCLTKIYFHNFSSFGFAGGRIKIF